MTSTSACLFLPPQLPVPLVRLWVAYLPVKEHVRLSWVNRQLYEFALERSSWDMSAINMVGDLFMLFHLFQHNWNRTDVGQQLAFYPLDACLDDPRKVVMHLDGVPASALSLRPSFLMDAKVPSAALDDTKLTFNGHQYFERKAPRQKHPFLAAADGRLDGVGSGSDSDREQDDDDAQGKCADQILLWGQRLFEPMMDVPNLLVPWSVRTLTVVLELPTCPSSRTFPAERRLNRHFRAHGLSDINWVALWRQRDSMLPVSPYEAEYNALYDVMERADGTNEEWDEYGELGRLQRLHFEWLAVHDKRRYHSASDFTTVSHTFRCPPSLLPRRSSFTIRHVLACVEVMLASSHLTNWARFRRAPEFVMTSPPPGQDSSQQQEGRLVCRLWRPEVIAGVGYS